MPRALFDRPISYGLRSGTRSNQRSAAFSKAKVMFATISPIANPSQIYMPLVGLVIGRVKLPSLCDSQKVGKVAA